MRRSCLVAAALAIALVVCSCADRHAFDPRRAAIGDAAKPAHAVNLGALRAGRRPSNFENQLAEFLFGEAPTAPMGFIKPIDLVARDGEVLISDAGYSGVLRQPRPAAPLSGAPLRENPTMVTAICAVPDGGLLAASATAGAVLRYDAAGQVVQRYTTPERMRVGGMAIVGQEVWVSNITAGRVEVFDLASAEHLRAVGRRGSGEGEFVAPLGIANMLDGNVCVVDVLGGRVHVFDAGGQWLRDIGAPGDGPGLLGRPKDVAVGPDGVVFVADTASRRVHAFQPDGTVVATFGDAGPDALAVPAGIAIASAPPEADDSVPPDFTADYYVLVAEQLARPGVRVFAWRTETPHASAPAAAALPDMPLAPNPHWRADRCALCHTDRSAPPHAISARQADGLCLSCHDGEKATAESHPIGRVATGGRISAPADWPLVDGQLACLTCHDIKRHCKADPVRPAVNPAMVRGFKRGDALASCRYCHQQEIERFNPHSDAAQSGDSPIGCRVCHLSASLAAANPEGGFPRLRQPAAPLCANCHTPHVDPAPGGHLGLVAAAAPSSLPLEDGHVTCATCHNPHAIGTKWRGRAIGARASEEEDAQYSLRLNYMELCRACHPK